MGLFGRRRAQPEPQDRVEWVTATARRMLAERGVETTVERGATPQDVTLVAADQVRYPLYNTLAKTQGTPAHEAERVIAAHLDGILARSPGVDELSADELRVRVRTRILFDAPAVPGEPTFAYARRLADGLITVLCVDFPQTVVMVSDANVGDLALDLDELYALGQRNTDAEPIDERFEPVPGVRAVAGDSLFIASKAGNLPAVFGPAPYGMLFGVPYRHLLLAVPITGPETAAALDDLVRLTLQIAGDGPHPGGTVSADVYFSREGAVERVSSLDEEGAVSVFVEGEMRRACDEAGVFDG